MIIKLDRKVKPLSFKANIIDSHVHRGSEGSMWNSVKFPTESLDEFIKTPLDVEINGQKQTDIVKRVLVSSIDGLSWSETQKKQVYALGKNKLSLKPEEVEFAKDEISANLDMINKFKSDDFYAVMAVCHPSKTQGSADNIRKLINENPGTITGLKFHPQDLLLNANSPLYDDYMKLAQEKNLPCLFHSQVAVDYGRNAETQVLNWADPQYIYDLAKRHPKVPVILGHMGAGGPVAHKKAIRILEESVRNNDANLYVDISWVDFVNGQPNKSPANLIDVIKKMQKAGHLEKILFGTDAPLGCFGEKLSENNGVKMSAKKSYEIMVSRTKTAIKNNFGDEAENIINKIFCENAEELFFKKVEGKKLLLSAKTKALTIITTGAAGVAYLGSCLFNKKDK